MRHTESFCQIPASFTSTLRDLQYIPGERTSQRWLNTRDIPSRSYRTIRYDTLGRVPNHHLRRSYSCEKTPGHEADLRRHICAALARECLPLHTSWCF